MTFLAGLTIALLRATLVALVAVALSWCVRAAMGSGRGRPGSRAGKVIVALLVFIFLTPTLMLGYAYSDGPLSLARHAFWNELLYSALLALKLLPVAVAVLVFAPAAGLSREAAFLRGLAPRESAMGRGRAWYAMRFLLHGRLRAAALAFVAVWLLAFCDFELAALLNVAAGRMHSAYTWTIALHEARQLSAPVGSILWRVVLVVLCEALVMGVGVWLLWGSRGVGSREREAQAFGAGARVIGAGALMLAFAAVCVIPGIVVLRGAMTGMGEVFSAFRFGDELLSSFYFAAGATGLVIITLAALGRPARASSPRKPDPRKPDSACPWHPALIALCVPGLLGALVLGMLLMGLFQLPVLRSLYDTPMPLVLGLALLMMPVAVLLRWFFDASEPASALHLAAMLRDSPAPSQQRAGRALRWELRGRSWFFLGAFVFYSVYLELVLCVTLSPVAMTPAIVELYNQMHYGQRALLSSLMAVTMLLPVAAVGLAWLVWRGVGRVKSLNA